MTGSLPAGAAEVLAECRVLADVFAAAGHRLYLVGGIVRDLFAGGAGPGHDLDFTTDALPERTKAVLSPVAEAVWTQGERFGTIAAHVDGRLVEVTTHRAEAYDPASRKPEVVYSSDVEEDLSRRDFTINSLALEVTAAEPALIDPFGGLADLRARRLATPRGPEQSFSDDPLRMLRAARFVARLDLTPDPALVSAVTELRERIAVVSVERVRDEVDKLLAVPHPEAGLRLLVDTGLLDGLVPELATAADVVARVPASRRPRLVALFADAGRGGAATRMRALKYPRDEVLAVARACEVVAAVEDRDEPWTDGAVRRLVHRGGDLVDDALEVVRARGGGGVADLVRARLDALDAAGDLHDLEAPLTGEEVMRHLGVEPGPAVGAALDHLLGLRLDEGRMDRGAALDHLDRWWALQRPG